MNMTDSSNNTQSLSSSTLKSATARSDANDQPIATATESTALNSSHQNGRKIVRTTAKRHLPRFSLGSSTHVNVVVLANKKKKKTKHNHSSTAAAFTTNDSAAKEKPSSSAASTKTSREQQQQQSSKNGTTTPPLILASSSSSQSSSSTLTPQHDLMNPSTARETNQHTQISSKATTPIVTPPPLPSEIQKQGLETKEASKTIPAGVHPKPVSTAALKTPPPKRKRKLPAKFRDNEDDEDDKKKKKSATAGTKPARTLPLTKVQRRLPTSSAAGSPATATESLKGLYPNPFNVDESKASKDTSANAAAGSFSFALATSDAAATGGHKLLPTLSFHRQPGNNFINKKPKLHSALQKKTPPQNKNNANSSSSKKKKKKSIPTGAETAEAQAADAAKRAEDDRKGIIIPRRHDVILGRGNGVAQHDGNVQFRQFCWSVRKAYLQAYRTEKREVAEAVCDMVRNLEPPGRFLQCVQNESKVPVWTMAPDNRILEKVCQALREKKWSPPVLRPHQTYIIQAAPMSYKEVMGFVRKDDVSKAKAIKSWIQTQQQQQPQLQKQLQEELHKFQKEQHEQQQHHQKLQKIQKQLQQQQQPSSLQEPQPKVFEISTPTHGQLKDLKIPKGAVKASKTSKQVPKDFGKFGMVVAKDAETKNIEETAEAAIEAAALQVAAENKSARVSAESFALGAVVPNASTISKTAEAAETSSAVQPVSSPLPGFSAEPSLLNSAHVLASMSPRSKLSGKHRQQQTHPSEENSKQVADSASMPNQHKAPIILEAGTRISVWWPLDNAYYDATVHTCSVNHHFIEYDDDGETEWLDLSKNNFRIRSTCE